MRHPIARACRALCFLSFASQLAFAEPSPPAPAEPASAGSRFAIPFEKYTLGNGLEVILHRDERLPMVAVNLWYHVGATHEPEGRSGFAHLFEHLMFEGSKHAGRRFDPLLESVGGTNMNGTTSWDRTNYYETVPSEHLELALWLEADRMGFMIDTLTKERVDVQREVVKNERRESYENAPYGKSWLRLYEELFPERHPYRGAVIGSMQDLSAASLADVKNFFQHFYAPGNATLCLSGNFDTAFAKSAIEKHFGTLRARGGRAAAKTSVPALAPEGKRAVVKEPVELAQVLWAWLAAPAYSADQAALEMAIEVLASGKASRLYQALVASGLANWVNADLDANQLVSFVTLDVGVASGHTPEEVEARLEQELRAFATHGPTAEELERARIGIEVAVSSELQLLNSSSGEGGRAGILQRLNHYLGDPGALPRVMQERANVTRETARAAVAARLDPTKRTTVVTLPEAPADGTH